MPDDTDPDDWTRPSPRRPAPDAHGQAALLLAESTLHALLDTACLTPEQAVAVVRTASEVKVDVATETGESQTRMRHSLALLAAIERSLDTEVRKNGEGPEHLV